MILVDTSIWIDHLRSGNATLAALLQGERVCIHPWVIGELACSQLANRAELLELLGALPSLAPASEEENFFLIEKRRLMGRGIGYVDVHLLAACVLHGTTLWTRDHHLSKIAAEFGLAHQTNAH